MGCGKATDKSRSLTSLGLWHRDNTQTLIALLGSLEGKIYYAAGLLRFFNVNQPYGPVIINVAFGYLGFSWTREDATFGIFLNGILNPGGLQSIIGVSHYLRTRLVHRSGFGAQQIFQRCSFYFSRANPHALPSLHPKRPKASGI